MVTGFIVAIILGAIVYAWKQRELLIQNKIHSTESSCFEQKLADAEYYAKGQDEKIAGLEQTLEELRNTLAKNKHKKAA